jgi:predicted GTPase
VVVDALRPGTRCAYYPGETNFRRADVLVINKVAQAKPVDVAAIRERARALNPRAQIVESDLEVEVDDPKVVRGRRVLVVEDGPTLTHGGMAYGAGFLAAERFGAAEIVDPRPHAVGTIRDLYRDYPHVERVLPALGYSDAQRKELRETILGAAPDLVLDASPARLDRLLDLHIPIARVHYRFTQRTGPSVYSLVNELLEKSPTVTGAPAASTRGN